MKKEIDIKLIALCLSNNREAQRQLYDLLLPYLNVICKRYLFDSNLLKDVLQEIFISLFRHLDQFNIQKASFKTWSTQIAINACLKCNKKSQHSRTEELRIDLHEIAEGPKVVDDISNEELISWLKKMPFQYYEVFNLHVIDGYSHDEIGKLLSIEAALSRQRLSRARAWVKKRLQGNGATNFNFSFN